MSDNYFSDLVKQLAAARTHIDARMADADLLRAYAKERAVDELSLPSLIDSHRRLVEELNASSRKEWVEQMQAARQQVESMTMNALWIRVSDLQKMTVQELVDWIGISSDR